MMEDFGDFGDEAFLGLCAEDWRDYAPLDAEENHQRQLERNRQRMLEDEVDDAWDRENERDLFDIVREHDEEYGDPDYPAGVGQDVSEFDEGADDYLNCDWRE